ncbi:hypothetical protein [Metabacillus schmidteae]|uniref:hypothetical protein n=1 Tax=Metabacillus schmidteae TaxID=2730405 RepID=UPI00158B62E7|nr:hypothetical protein [Metabacillus schmidteae]
MTIFLICTVIFNMLISITIYKILVRKKKIFNDRFGMIMAMSLSGVISLSIAMNIQFLFSVPSVPLMIITVLTGGFIGVLFGSLVKFQSLLAGYSQGILGSVMGSMFGAVVLDPALCSLPIAYVETIQQNTIIFSLFSTCLVLSTSFLIYYSLRV